MLDAGFSMLDPSAHPFGGRSFVSSSIQHPVSSIEYRVQGSVGENPKSEIRNPKSRGGRVEFLIPNS